MYDDTVDFTAEDLDELNLLMGAFPGVRSGFRAVIAVSRQLSFPVESAEALRAAVTASGSGDDGTGDIPVDRLADLMPPYYFPISHEEDFVAKVADACSRTREPDGPNMPTLVLQEAVAPMRGAPPNITPEQVVRMARLDERVGVAGAGGLDLSDASGA